MNNTEYIDTVESLHSQFAVIKQAYKDAPAPSYLQRKEVLQKLKHALIEHEQEIYEALSEDYGYRSEFDTFIADILPSVAGINYALKKLKKWMKPSRRHAGIMLAPAKVTVHYQPLGVVGVVTPWNFPFYLALGPAIQALAAGNRVMIKMSELTPHANQVLRKVVEPISDHVIIIEGEAEMGAAFSALPFDHLIFTGSTQVGKLVAKSAAENLTPITLELGGKSPTIIAEDSDMNVAVDALILGKATNSGQICVAPDYVFVPEGKEQELIETFRERYHDYHLGEGKDNRQTHIVTDRQYERLDQLLKDAEAKGGVVHPVRVREANDGRLIFPHLVTNVTEEMSVMQEEIFGSLMPIMTYKNIDEVIEYINDRPKPLALYVMSKNQPLIDRVLRETHSGGVAINTTTMHVAADDAPFGGVGNSGMGHYHGHEGFLTFSKAKTVLHSPAWLPKNRLILKNRNAVMRGLRKLAFR